MKTRAFPLISSFVIRFVVDPGPTDDNTKPTYRGAIRHIQSKDELNFSTLKEVVGFIQRYVPLETETGRTTQGADFD